MTFFKRSMADNFGVSDGIRSKFKFIHALVHVLKICKNEEGPIKKRSLEKPQHFSRYKSMVIFFSDTQGHVTPQTMIGSGRTPYDLTVFFVNCKVGEDPNKNKGTRGTTTVTLKT